MNEESEVLATLRTSTQQTTAELDARILAAATAALSARKSGQHWLWLLPAAAAAATLAYFALTTGTSEPDPTQAERNEPEAIPSSTTFLGFPLTVGIDETLKTATHIVRLRLTTATVTGMASSIDGDVLDVFHGDASIRGQKITVHGNPSELRGGAKRSLLCVQNLAYIGEGLRGTCWLLPLVRKKDGFRNPFSEGLYATRMPSNARAKGAPQKPKRRVRGALLAALDDPDAEVRQAAIAALRNWEGMRIREPGDRLFRDPAVAKRLLAAGRDPDERVRWTVAWMVPKSAGKPGEALLLRLLFDPSRMVRQPARHYLGKRGHADVVAALQSIQDHPLDERTGATILGVPARPVRPREIGHRLQTLASHHQATIRARAAWVLGHQETAPRITSGLLDALRTDDDANVRRWAAWSLGQQRHADPTPVRTELHTRASNAAEDGRVRVMAADALRRLEDPRGYRLLVELTKGADLRAAVQALELLSPLGTKHVLDVLFAATRDKRAPLRAFAAIALPRYGKIAEHKIAAELTRLAEDPSQLVRVAARVAKTTAR